MKASLAALLCTATFIAGTVPFASAVDTVIATPTRDMGQTVYVDGTRVYPTGYNIADNNYFKLRDIGALVGFGVEWNQDTQTVEISTTRIAPSTEGIKDTAVSGAVAKVSDQRIAVDGIYVNMKAYQIGGNNYIKLRDIGLQVNFSVSFDGATDRVIISPKLFYGEEPAETPTAPDADVLDAYAQEVIRLTNEERAKVGLSALKVNDKLMQAAAIRANELTKQFAHLRPNGDEIYSVFGEVGYDLGTKLAGEVAAYGQKTPQTVVNAWMQSQGHKDWLLSEECVEVGAGIAISSSGTFYWTQIFAGA